VEGKKYKKGYEFGILTNEIYKNTFDEDYKSLMKIKDLDKNLSKISPFL